MELSHQTTTNKGQRYQTNDSYKKQTLQSQVKYTSGTLVATERITNSSKSPKRCKYCEREHWSDECDKYKAIEERKNKSCFRCLKDNHMVKDCKSVCVLWIEKCTPQKSL